MIVIKILLFFNNIYIYICIYRIILILFLMEISFEKENVYCLFLYIIFSYYIFYDIVNFI